jgi:hypothetical protein
MDDLDLFGNPMPMKRKTVAQLESQYQIEIRQVQRPWKIGDSYVIRDYVFNFIKARDQHGPFVNLLMLEKYIKNMREECL